MKGYDIGARGKDKYNLKSHSKWNKTQREDFKQINLFHLYFRKINESSMMMSCRESREKAGMAGMQSRQDHGSLVYNSSHGNVDK